MVPPQLGRDEFGRAAGNISAQRQKRRVNLIADSVTQTAFNSQPARLVTQVATERPDRHIARNRDHSPDIQFIRYREGSQGIWIDRSIRAPQIRTEADSRARQEV